jgi:hypothetical protein
MLNRYGRWHCWDVEFFNGRAGKPKAPWRKPPQKSNGVGNEVQREGLWQAKLPKRAKNQVRSWQRK